MTSSEWDDAKAERNLANHGISFDTASLAFEDPFAVAREDRRHDYGEDRYVLLGMVDDRLLAVTIPRRPDSDHLRSISRATGKTALS
ncbi:MAG TPA: BrnT family toxin [Xanthobacteraceae bacterium]